MRSILSDFKYLAAYVIPLLTFLTVGMGSYWTMTPVLFAFVFIPLLEHFTQGSEERIPEIEKQRLLSRRLFDVLLYLNLPIVFGLVYYVGMYLESEDLSWLEQMGIVLSLGIVLGSNGINVAHELGHRKNKLEILMAQMLLLPSFYMHFYIEHNRGHHKNVGTDKDPASAKKDESVYHFWIRSVVFSYLSAWNIQMTLLKREQKSFLSVSNKMLLFMIIQGLYLSLLFICFGLKSMILLALAGVVGLLLLETINYIEHYGLRRKEIKPGVHERVRPEHSWNSNHPIGRIMLYELTRHSDHHYLASKKYQILEHHGHSPKLPEGYPASMMISLIPPLWFRLVNPLIKNRIVENEKNSHRTKVPEG